MDKFRIVVIFGTRPEAIKLWPLIVELRKNEKLDIKVVNSGQHDELMREILKECQIHVDETLSVITANQTLNRLSASILLSVEESLLNLQPHLVIVQGDTSTAFYSALVAFHLKIPISHIEAGLRSYNIEHPFPEEFHRCSISKISKLNFAPTEVAFNNLVAEGISRSSIFLTGNTGIDALRSAIEKLELETQEEDLQEYVLVTCHRRESSGVRLSILISAIKQFCLRNPDYFIKFTKHLNPEFYSTIQRELSGITNVELLEPQSYFSFIRLLKNCTFVVTDSGGIQEEAPYLKKPTLVYRELTERIESVNLGVSRFISADPEDIVREMERAARGEFQFSKNYAPYGDGYASIRIQSVIEEFLEGAGPIGR